MKLTLGNNHVFGDFEWQVEPNCSCGLFKTAIEEEKFILVSNFANDDSNMFYFMPLTNDGDLVRNSGVEISYCPLVWR